MRPEQLLALGSPSWLADQGPMDWVFWFRWINKDDQTWTSKSEPSSTLPTNFCLEFQPWNFNGSLVGGRRPGQQASETGWERWEWLSQRRMEDCVRNLGAEGNTPLFLWSGLPTAVLARTKSDLALGLPALMSLPVTSFHLILLTWTRKSKF